MTYTIIKSEEQYQEYLDRIETVIDTEPGTSEFDELELLSMLISKYEVENYPLPEPDPVDVIQYYMEQKGLKAKDLVGILGDKTTVSKILSKERKLNLGMVRRLSKHANIPTELLIREY